MFDDPPGPFPLGLRTLTTSDPYQLSRSPELGRSPFWERPSRAQPDLETPLRDVSVDWPVLRVVNRPPLHRQAAAPARWSKAEEDWGRCPPSPEPKTNVAH